MKTPAGQTARWAADDPNPANQPQALTFGTSMPGGFSDLGCTLERDPRRAYADLEELSDVTVAGAGETAWQGRLEKLPDTGGSQAQTTPQAVGYQSHLDDDGSALEIYVDQTTSPWQTTPLARQQALLGSGWQLNDSSSLTDPENGAPVVATQWQDAWTVSQVSEAWYDAGAPGLISQVYWSFVPTSSLGGNAGFALQVLLTPDSAAASSEASGNLYPGHTFGGSGLFAPATAERFACAQMYWSSGAAGSDGVTYNALWRFAVIGDHGLPLQGAWPAAIGVLASDVVTHALGKWAPKIGYSTGANGTIRPSSYAIPQLAFTTPTTASAIIKQAVQYELLDWAVWEGPTFYLNARGESPKTRNWRARIGPAQLQETGPDVSRIFNGAIVSYTDAAGVARAVGPPGSGAQSESSLLLDADPQNPATQAGLKRYALVSMGTTTLDGATQVGQIFLRTQKIVDTSGQASLVGHAQDDRGVWWPAWLVRAGDTITFTDARDTRPRRVVSTSYDHSTKTNAVQLDQPPDVMSELLAGMSESIAPFGLS